MNTEKPKKMQPLLDLLRSENITQTQLAGKLSLTRQAITNMIKTDNTFIKTFYDIADIYNKKLDIKFIDPDQQSVNINDLIETINSQQETILNLTKYVFELKNSKNKQ